MKRKTSSGRVLALSMILAVSSSLPAFAASWQQDSAGWRWKQDNGEYAAGGWQWLDGNHDGISECYYFNANGYMLANTTTPDGYKVDGSGAWVENGIVKTKSTSGDPGVTVPNGMWRKGAGANANKWWWQNMDGSYASGGWYWLDGDQDGIAECYYFDAAGWALSSCQTPDGYQVDANGKWLDGQTVKTRKVNRNSNGSGKGNSSSGGTSTAGTNTEVDAAWKDYYDSSVGKSAGDFKTGNFGKMSASQWAEAKKEIENFKKEYLTNGMSDFEKEIKIVEWLVENCSYEQGEDWSRSTAYSCIVLGKAQCSGYADAFLQTAKLCGLDVRYVQSASHAWNLVKLDGDWYHVDVTWEDPLGDNDYGFGNLRNRYINLTDSAIRDARSHSSWTPDTISAKGTKYGPSAVAAYMKRGTTEISKELDEEDERNEIVEDFKKRSGSTIISYTDIDGTVDQIMAHMEDLINNKKDAYAVLLQFGDTYNASNSGDFQKAIETKDKIAASVEQKLNEEYADTLDGKKRFHFNLSEVAGGEYYCYENGKLEYQTMK